MIVYLSLLGLAMAFIVVRFVSPGVVYWVRDIVASGKIHRQMLSQANGGTLLKPRTFRVELQRTMQYHAVNATPQGVKQRCMRISELLSMMTARHDEANPRSADTGGAMIELADMLSHLGARMGTKLDPPAPILSSEDILIHAVALQTGKKPPTDPDERDDWLNTHTVNVRQVGEIVIAAVFALAVREERRRQSTLPPPKLG